MIKIASESFGYVLDLLSGEVSNVGKRPATNIVKSVGLLKHGGMNLNWCPRLL